MEYIFPPPNIGHSGVIVAPPTALQSRQGAASFNGGDDTFSVASHQDYTAEVESHFAFNEVAASDWRPLIQLTLGLDDLYSWIRAQVQGQQHRKQQLIAAAEDELVASYRGHAPPSIDVTDRATWDDCRPPTPSLTDSAASTPSASVRSRGHPTPRAPGKHVVMTGTTPPAAATTAQQTLHRDPFASLPPMMPPRAPSSSHLTSPPLSGGSSYHYNHHHPPHVMPPQLQQHHHQHHQQLPIFVTAIPRVLTEPSELVAKLHSDGIMYEVDNANGDLVLFVGMVLCERYEVIKILGAGTFGQVALCRDHYAVQHNAESSGLSRVDSVNFLSSANLSRRGSLRFPKHSNKANSSASMSQSHHRKAAPMPELVAVKVIKSDAAYERQSALEVNVVREMAHRFPQDPRLDLIVRSYGHGYSFGHYCLVFELLGVNLFDVLTANQYAGMDLSAVREVAQQLLMAVSLCHDCGITHSDIKPENVLMARAPMTDDNDDDEDEDDGTPRPPQPTGSIRLIDFGAAFRTGHCPFTYIQSRYYRAPEVIIDADLTASIDIWSVGCVLAELFLGLPLLPGGDDFQQLELMQEMIGPFPMSLVSKGRLSQEYFSITREPSPSAAAAMPPRSGSEATGSGTMPDSSPQLLNRTMTNPFDDWSASSDSVPGSPVTIVSVWPADEFYSRHASLPRPAPQPKYFNYSSIAALVDNYPLSQREKEWAVDAQAKLNSTQGNKPSANFTQPVIDAILGVRRSFTSLLQSLLKLDPLSRPTAAAALMHPFFTQDLPQLDTFGDPVALPAATSTRRPTA